MNPHLAVRPSLAELQKWMRWMITDPRGVDDALSNPHPKINAFQSRYTCPGDDLRDTIEETPELARSERLSIYAEGYFARIAEVLSQDFATIHRAIGAESFLKLTADYLKAYPSRFTNIGEIGKFLPKFLATYEMTLDYPFLSELASLEWAVIESFYANDLPRITETDLRAIPEASWPQAKFSIDPSVRLIQVNWPVRILWDQKGDDTFESSLESIEAGHRTLLIFRDTTSRVQVLDQDPIQARVLNSMSSGKTLAEMCEEILVESAAPPLMEWFRNWIALGVIQAIRVEVI